ncbi:uncharacterized protein LOC131292928 [Anopheles ziemanni]|uniref:uncharacterized protein LOC131292928 n=1 Tax=Anopheles ziemanni TaxID=345580 RepID=UPI00265EE065|nr:uncharacterized protein LOC131292928 [Anopheles ziemanni]
MVSSSDGLPDKLCKNCVNKMIMAYDFRITCNCTEEHLSILKQERHEENPEARSTEINPNQLHSDSEDGEITIEETIITPVCFNYVPFRNPDLASLDSDMSPASSRTVNTSRNHAGSSVSAAFDMLPTVDNTDSEANQTTIDHSTRPKFRCNNCSKEYFRKTSFLAKLATQSLARKEACIDIGNYHVLTSIN